MTEWAVELKDVKKTYRTGTIRGSGTARDQSAGCSRGISRDCRPVRFRQNHVA